MKPLWIVLAVGLVGCGMCWFLWHKSRAKIAVPSPEISSIKIEDVAANVPQFRRIYTSNLSNGRVLKITARTWSYGTSLSGELDQPDGKWILFEPEAPADKIIDRELIGMVQSQCREIIQMDKEFRDSHPARFSDEHGDVWTKEPK